MFFKAIALNTLEGINGLKSQLEQNPHLLNMPFENPAGWSSLFDYPEKMPPHPELHDTPLAYACRMRHQTIITWLKGEIGQNMALYARALKSLAFNASLDAVKDLLEGLSAEQVRECINARTDFPQDTLPALHSACIGNSSEVIIYFIENGACLSPNDFMDLLGRMNQKEAFPRQAFEIFLNHPNFVPGKKAIYNAFEYACKFTDGNERFQSAISIANARHSLDHRAPQNKTVIHIVCRIQNDSAQGAQELLRTLLGREEIMGPKIERLGRQIPELLNIEEVTGRADTPLAICAGMEHRNFIPILLINGANQGITHEAKKMALPIIYNAYNLVIGKHNGNPEIIKNTEGLEVSPITPRYLHRG